MKTAKLAVALMAAMAVGGVGYAQVFDLDPVTVTATRTEMNVSEVPANVEVFDRVQIEQGHYQDVGEALRQMTGTDVRDYGAGVGYTANGLYINGTNSVVVLVDGVRADSFGVKPQLRLMTNLDNVERIELLKGAASAMYGSDAIGGVINIVTRQGDAGMHTELTVAGGSYGAEEYSLRTSGSAGEWDWQGVIKKSIVSDFTDANGLVIPQHNNANNYSIGIGWEPNDAHRIGVNIDRYDAYAMFSDDNKHLEKRRYLDSDVLTSKVSWDWQVSDKLAVKNAFLYKHYDAETYDPTGKWSKYYGNEVKTKMVSSQWTFDPNDDLRILMGGEWTKHDVINKSKEVRNTAMYMQVEWTLADRLTISPGVRFDHYSMFGSNSTPHVSLSYKLSDKTNAYVSYNEFFLAPTLKELYDAKYGNPDVNPQSGDTWEIGLNHQLNDRTVMDVHAFKREINDKIVWNVKTGVYENLGKSEKSDGVDFNVKSQLTPELFARLGYTFTNVDETESRTRNVDGYVPRHAIVAGLSYTKDALNVNFDLRGTIDRLGPQTSDVIGDFFPKSTYWIADLSANYDINDDITVFGRVNNLFDTFYAENSGATNKWAGYGIIGAAEQWWSAPGRNYRVGMTVRF